MTARRKREYLILGGTAACIALAMALRVLSRVLPGSHPVLTLSRSAIYIVLMSAWSVSLRRRVIQTQARRYLTAAAALTVLWLALRTVKYSLPNGCAPGRYLWYLYYLPMLFIPTLSVFIALSLGRAENYRLPRWANLLYLPAAALLSFVLTNDLHQLVFSFPTGVMSDLDYGYAPGYYVVVGYMGLCLAAAFLLMLFKCRLPHSKTYLFRPLIPIFFLIIYCIAYATGVHWVWVLAGDLTVTVCLGVAAIFESCIRCGLIPSNVGYEELFAATTIGAQITNAAFAVTHASAGAQPIAKEHLAEASRGTVSLNRNTLLKAHPLETGYVFWQEDISELADTEEQLELTREELRETGDILKAEREQKARWLRLREENRLYDRIEQDTALSLSQLRDRIARLRQTGDITAARQILAEIVVIGTYIKRRSNLIFVASQRGTVTADELRLCLNESAANLPLCGAECRVTVDLQGAYAAEDIYRIYDLFEAVVEESLGSLRSLLLVAEERGGAVQTHICVSAGASLLPLAARFPALEIEQDEDTLWYLTLPKGGARE